MRSRSRISRGKADWVYRGPLGIPGDPSDNDWYIDQSLSTYTPVAQTVTSGPAGAFGFILYDSTNRLSILANTWDTAAGFGTVAALSRAARAEGRKPLCLRVSGQVLIRPSTWAVGSLMYFGMRVGVFEQDPSIGTLLLNADYSMLQTTTQEWSDSPAVMANDRNWVWQRHFFRGFRSDEPAPGIMVDINVPMRRSLKSNECLALYFEGASTSVNLSVTRFLRTLVVDES